MKKHSVQIEDQSVFIMLKGSKNAFQVKLTDEGLTLKVVNEEGEEISSLYACNNAVLKEKDAVEKIFPRFPKKETPKGVAKIKAKLKTKCPVCGKQIQIGDDIQWKKGSPAVCCDCDFPDDLPVYQTQQAAPQTKVCCQCGKQFTYAESLQNGGDWRDSHCGCK